MRLVSHFVNRFMLKAMGTTPERGLLEIERIYVAPILNDPFCSSQAP